jgi:hypothetical protein
MNKKLGIYEAIIVIQNLSVGVLPHGSIGSMTENVWWIAAGSQGSSSSTSSRTVESGKVYMLDMTKQAFSKLINVIEIHR